MKPLLLFGGTFDPVHRGHVVVAGEVAHAIGEPVRLMPAAVPPHRETPGADAAQRLHMLRLAVEDHPELRVDDRELRRDGPSWTVETLRQLRQEIGDRQPVVILVGADAFAKFDTWCDWREILDLAHVLVLTRPGVGGEWSSTLRRAVEPRLAESIDALCGEAAGRVLPFAVESIPVSSTAVRRRLAAGEPARDLLPASVSAYLDRHPIYRTAR
jgi:nicotinate-nucleotide adenylyltransferase